jgi:serine/threonine protein kinase
MVQGKPDHYNLTTPLAKKYSHSTYLASSHDEPEQEVIVIVFSPSLFPSLRERKAFLQKAQRLIKELQHPHILPLLDAGIEGKQPFVVRDYLSRGSLRSYLKELSPKRLELHDALTIVLQVGEALAYAHQQNIFHGNLKPENILFDTNGQAMLTDFHLVGWKNAIIHDQTSEEYACCYIAPEQFAGRTDAGSDQYALGCLAYELITGQLPFASQPLTSMIGWPNYTLPAPLSEHVADLSPALEAAILKTLAKDPAERFFDFSLFLEVIQSIVSPLANSRGDLFTDLLATSSPTHSSREHKKNESSINHRDTVHELDVAEMALPLSSPDGRGRSLKRNLQRKRRSFWLVPFGLLIVALVITAWNNDTAFLSVKESAPDMSVYQKPTQVIIRSLVLGTKPDLPTPAATQAKVPTPSTTPTPQSTLSSPTVTSPTPTPVPAPVLQTTTVDDSVMGTGLNQFNYVGSGWQHTSSEGSRGTPPPYQGTNSWDGQTNDYVTVSFSGVQIKFFGVIDTIHGIGAISIDGGTETMIDFYSSVRRGNQLLWTSPMLPAGTHTFKLRVTGTQNPNSTNNYYVVPDRVDILS